MHISDVYEPTPKIVKCLSHGSGVGAFGRGKYDHIVKMYYIIENLLLTHINNNNVEKEMHEALYLLGRG